MDTHFQKRSIRCREGLFHNPQSSQSIEVAASEHSDVQSQSCQNHSGQIPTSVQSHIVFSDRIHPFWTDLRLFPGIVAQLFNNEESRVNIDLVDRKIRDKQRSQTHQIVSLTRRFVICSSRMIGYRSHTDRYKTVRSFLSSISQTSLPITQRFVGFDESLMHFLHSCVNSSPLIISFFPSIAIVTTTMSLPTWTVEMLHRIFDDLIKQHSSCRFGMFVTDSDQSSTPIIDFCVSPILNMSPVWISAIEK